MKKLRQWKITGESLARLRPLEAEGRRLVEEIERLEEQLAANEEQMFLAVHKELGLKESISFSLNPQPSEELIVQEESNTCPDCGEPHETTSQSVH